MQLKKIKCIILNIKPHGDFDRMLDVFCEETGRMRVIAKGVRRIKSRRGCHLDLLNYCRMELELCGAAAAKTPYLREVFTLNGFPNIKKNLSVFASACLIACFLQKTLPEKAPQMHLFKLTKEAIEALNNLKNSKTILFHYFSKTIKLMGYLPYVLPEKQLRNLLAETLEMLNPQFTLKARRILGIFSNFDSRISS